MVEQGPMMVGAATVVDLDGNQLTFGMEARASD
jgi:hypothetical protein